MERITIFDTSVCTENIGDEIIMDSIKLQLRTMFNRTMFLRVPTHERITRISKLRMGKTKFGFVGGTNLLALDMLEPINQWNIHIWDLKKLNNVILMGVGAQAYCEKINFYTKYLYRKILKGDYIHSVRDSYTESVLKSIGITNVVNTGCPTLWNLTESHCNKIPKSKAENVICTFTDYNRDRERDTKLANVLFKNYKNVYCWIQGTEDYEYIKSISDNFIFVNPHLEEYDKILSSEIDLDYIGTRLHAGIRAMQKYKRSIILVIDNRAREMGKDFNLNIIERDNIDELEKYINSDFKTDVKLPIDKINIWKNQFK